MGRAEKMSFKCFWCGYETEIEKFCPCCKYVKDRMMSITKKNIGDSMKRSCQNCKYCEEDKVGDSVFLKCQFQEKCVWWEFKDCWEEVKKE